MGLAPNADYAATIPHLLFMIFQMMFAVITPALIIGAFAERMKFSAFLVFSLLWATLVYDPMAHWVWGVGGWLRDLGALDFAGGTVVHINAGMAALAAALVLGKRKGYPDTSPPHNLPFAILGAALLWFGWFGFNAGSALGAGGLAVSAFVATHLAAAAAAVGLGRARLDPHPARRPLSASSPARWPVWWPSPRPPASSPRWALWPSAPSPAWSATPSVMFMKGKLGYDDSLDAFGVHGIGGMLGRPAHRVSGRPRPSTRPAPTASSTAAASCCSGSSSRWSARSPTRSSCPSVLLKLIDKTIGLRVTAEHESIGLDLTQHSESAYTVVG